MVELYRRIWSATGSEQVILIVLSLVVAALAAVPLQFQKDIVNGLAGDMNVRKLILLCGAYFGILIFTFALKIALRYRSSVLSESVVQRIRANLYEGANKSETEVDKGTLITKIADESDEVGKFAGDAIAAPLLQFGTLVSVIAFVATTQPSLGLFIFVLILPQAFLVIYMQRFVNTRVAVRVKMLRDATSKISHTKAKKLQQSILDDFDSIFEKQREIFRIKLSLKFILNVLTGLGTVGILLIGGLLYLKGRTDIGTVVASLSAFQRVNGPWQTLIAFYRQLSSVRVRFELLLPRSI